MTPTTARAIAYPIVVDDGLEINPVYRELQEERGTIRAQLAAGPECWVALSYEDARAVHADRRFVKELGHGKVMPRNRPIPLLDPSMLANMDPPRHTRIRKLTSAAFARPRIRALKDWVELLSDQLLDSMVERGQPADFQKDFAWALPNLVVTGILGIPGADIPEFRGYVDGMLDPTNTSELRDAAGENLRAYIRRLVASRREHLTDDVFSDLVSARDDEDRLSEDELVMLFQSLFLGGFETTVSQLGATLCTLLTYRDLWAELVENRALLPAALEELWRWIPTTKYGEPLPRWAAEDVELSSGVVIPAGDIIIPERAVANRDEAVFPHASEVDFHRDDPQPHLTLGWGQHHCVGANLAHMEIEITLERMLDRFPNLALAIPADEVVWSRRHLLRCVESLPVTW